jgi:hypothetical protein
MTGRQLFKQMPRNSFMEGFDAFKKQKFSALVEQSNELNQTEDWQRHIYESLTAYLITMVVINGNICIAEIYHPTCKINAN